ncbi:MAG TPA: hypothetical protein VIY28_18345, partial [Pseudonocardiaceae bacterium]
EGLMAGIIRAEDVAVIENWVGKGCPQPGAPQTASETLSRTLASAAPLPSVPFATRRQTIGHGSVH